MPVESPRTVAVKVQGPLPAVIAPAARETVEAVNAGVPLQPVPVMAPTAVTVRPAGKVSVKARPLWTGLPVELATVKVRVEVPFKPMVDGE